MTNALHLFRVVSPYVWRLRPHAVIPILLLLALGLPRISELLIHWDFSQLQGIERVQGWLYSYRLILQSLVLLALLRWARQLAAFPVYNVAWSHIVWALLFYWLVIASAFLGPSLAIDRSLRTMRANMSDAQAAHTDLDRLRAALCEFGPGSEPSPELLNIVEKWYGQETKALRFEMLTLRNPGWGGRWNADFKSESFNVLAADIRRLLRHCRDEHADALYEISERQARYLEIQGKDTKESFLITLDLIGGLATVSAFADYADRGQGPFAIYNPATYGYFVMCLLASIALLLITERIGGGFFRLAHFAEHMRNKLPHLAFGVPTGWSVRNYPVYWALGIPRLFTDIFILAGSAILITSALDQLHLPLMFTDEKGRVRESIQQPLSGTIAFGLFCMLLLIAVREPLERASFASFWKNCLHTTLVVSHFCLLFGASILAILLTHETWSHLHGFSRFGDLQIATQAEFHDLFAFLAVLFPSLLLAVIRLSCLAGGLRLGASIFLTIVVGVLAAILTWDYEQLAFWSGMVVLLLCLWIYSAQRFSNPWVQGAFLGILLVGFPLCALVVVEIYSSEIRSYLAPSFGDVDIIIIGTAYLMALAVFSLGLRRVTWTLQTPG